MKIKDILEELQETSHYLNFKKEHDDIFFIAAFLILNLENKTEEIHLDYFIPSTNKIAVFSYPFQKPKIHDDIISTSKKEIALSKMEYQSAKIKIDIDNLESKCNQLIKENNSALVPTKIIAILKNDIWNLTLMDNMLGIIRIKINAISEEVIDFNKGGLMDFARIKK